MESEGPGLADAFGAALEEPGVPVGQETGAVLGAGLFVGREGEHDVPPRTHPAAGPPADHGEHHRVHVLHVDGAAAPDHTVADLPGEGVHTPVGGLGGHHVEMAVHQQGIGRGVGALDTGDHIGTALAALQQRRRQSGPGQPLGDVLGGRALLTGAVTGVAGVDPDQVGGEPHHLVERLPVHTGGLPGPGLPGGLHLSHIVPPRRTRRRW